LRHGLSAAVARAMPAPLSPTAARYLDLLDRRLAAIEALAEAGTEARFRDEPGAKALARRFLRPLEGTWDDGDENLVRGYLDRWRRSSHDPVRQTARALRDAANTLAGLEARPATFWCFLWHLESAIELLTSDTIDSRR
jgi:hypothetical protein